jgi:hypothetical protein
MNATIPLLHLDSLTETQVGPTAAPLPHLLWTARTATLFTKLACACVAVPAYG